MRIVQWSGSGRHDLHTTLWLKAQVVRVSHVIHASSECHSSTLSCPFHPTSSSSHSPSISCSPSSFSSTTSRTVATLRTPPKKKWSAHRAHVYHSQREGLSVGQSSSSVSERTGDPLLKEQGDLVVASGQELNVEHAQIRLLDRQKEQILAECQEESKKYEFQTNYDRRSV